MIKPTTQYKESWLKDPPSPTLITAAEGSIKASKVILYATSMLLVLIWMSTFIISYVSLVAIAIIGGLTYPWVWLWPLLLDAFMCIGSLDVIRRELNGETTTIAWAVVIGVTLVSTGFNITPADPSVLSWATHALAPVVCFLAFEIEMGVLRSHFRQHDNDSKMSDPMSTLLSVLPGKMSGTMSGFANPKCQRSRKLNETSRTGSKITIPSTPAPVMRKLGRRWVFRARLSGRMF